MSFLFNFLMRLLIILLTTIFTGLILPRFSMWLESKTENEKLQSVIQDLTVTARTAVNELEQTLVKQYKDNNAWDLKAQKIVLQEAVEKTIASLLESTKETLKVNENNLEDTVRRYIESYIQSKKGGSV